MGKIMFAFLLAAALALTTFGCKDQEPEQPEDEGQPEVTREEVRQKIDEASRAVDEAAQATTEKAIQESRERLADIEENWRKLNERIAESGEEAREDFKKLDQEMRENLSEVRKRLAEAGDATAERFRQDVKPALESALDSAQKAFDDAAKRLNPDDNDNGEEKEDQE